MNIFTYDDLMFENDILVPESLPINYYLKYKDDINYLKLKIKDKPQREEIKLSNLYLFTFNRGVKSGGNFFHFHFHYLQRLVDFFNLKDIKIGIPLNMLQFQKEIILKLIPEDKIIYLDIYRYNYNISNCYIGKYYNASNLPEILFNKYQNLCDINNINLKNENIIYIKRKIKDNAGKNRYITNENDFSNYISSSNIQIFHFEDYNINDKITSLLKLNPKILIMEIGAGLTNLLFLKKDLFENIKILLIDHNEWMISKCSRMKNILNLLNIQYSVLTCNTKYNNLDNDKRNNPFEINIHDFSSILNNLN